MATPEQKSKGISNQLGFTLVEMLVVVAIMGIIASAIFALYLNSQRTALEQEDIVDVQQSIRFALDQIERDIRMAGFLVPSTDPGVDGPIISAPNVPTAASPLTLQTASSGAQVLRVATRFLSPSSATTAKEVTVDSTDMAVLFKMGDYARIIRPDRCTQPLNAILQFTGDPVGATISLKGFSSETQYEVGDMIVLATATAPYPNTIAYSLENNEIRRSVNGGAKQTLATGISQLEFQYLMDGGTESSSVTGASLLKIRGVRVAISGQVATQNGAKIRSATSVVTLRNKVD